MPPLTCIVSPVIYEAWSDDRKATELATSSAFPSLDMGILDVKTAFTLSVILSVIFDWINPGEKSAQELLKKHSGLDFSEEVCLYCLFQKSLLSFLL